MIIVDETGGDGDVSGFLENNVGGADAPEQSCNYLLMCLLYATLSPKAESCSVYLCITP